MKRKEVDRRSIQCVESIHSTSIRRYHDGGVSIILTSYLGFRAELVTSRSSQESWRDAIRILFRAVVGGLEDCGLLHSVGI